MQADFRSPQGRFTFQDPVVPGASIVDAITWVHYRRNSGKIRQVRLQGQRCTIEDERITDVHGEGRQLIIHMPTDSDGIELTYRVNHYERRPFILLQIAVSNFSPEPIYLQEICLCQADRHTGGKLRWTGPQGALRFFKVGWHGWAYTGLRTANDRNSRRISDFLGAKSYLNPVTPRIYAPGEFWSEGWGILVGDSTGIVAGFASTDRQFGQVYTCIRPEAEAIKLIAQMDDTRLDPGETRVSDWGYLEFNNLPNVEPCLNYVETVSRQMKARLPTSPPPAMWTHWYQFFNHITAQLFLENLDSLAAQRSRVPFQVAELDDGYQFAWGDWTKTNAKFPGGLGDFAGKVNERGFVPGLWLAPFTVQPNADIAREHPDWLLKDAKGKPINAGFLYNRFVHALDTSHPAVLKHVRQLMDTIAHQWGFGMVKVDFINTSALPGQRYNPKLTRAECLRMGLEAVRQGVGEETFVLASGCPFGPAIGIVDAMRIGPDTAPSWEPYFHWLPWAGPLIRNETSPPSMRNALRHTLNLSSLHQRWWWNDPDCLLVRDTDTRLTLAEVQSAITLIGLSGGMIVSSDDLRTLNPERLRWISLLLPNLGLRGLPLDILIDEMPELYQVKLEHEGETWQLVGIFNWKNQPSDRRIDFAQLGFPDGVELDVFDFWYKQYVRTKESHAVFSEIPPHGCRLLRISESRPSPRIVGDTLHISGGGEIVSHRFSNGNLRIETMDLGRWVEGDLWLRLLEDPTIARCNDENVEITMEGDSIYRLQLHFLGQGRIEVVLR